MEKEFYTIISSDGKLRGKAVADEEGYCELEGCSCTQYRVEWDDGDSTVVCGQGLNWTNETTAQIIAVGPNKEKRVLSSHLKLEGIPDVQKHGAKNLNLIDLIIDAELSEEAYTELKVDRDENPKDAWALWVSQNDYDRIENQVSFSLCNEGLESDLELTDEEKKEVFSYIKEKGFDIKAGLMMDENTKLL